MDFKTRPISRSSVKSSIKAPSDGSIKSLSNFKSSNLKIQLITLLAGLGIVLLMLFLIIQLVKSLDFSNIIFSFGKKLTADTHNQTNFLLVGIGGEGHDGAYLTDSILVATLDYDHKMVAIFAIPRDLFVETKQTGRSRINEILSLANNKYGKDQAMNILSETVGKVTGLDIQYYIRIDFKGFVKIVDSLGGIDVHNEKALYDPEYPLGETIQYTTFSLPAGDQHLDGATALKYARTRHGNTGGNFGRAARQQQIMYALKEKALSLKILTNPGKIQEIFSSVKESIDTNLTLQEIIELGKISKEINQENIFTSVINDDPTECGGLVYTPAREFFSGASVLLPAGGNFDYIQQFTTNLNQNMKSVILGQKQDKIQVLNGTKSAGLAYNAMSLIARYCLPLTYYGNAEARDLTESTIYYKPDSKGTPPPSLELINKIIPGIQNIPQIPEAYLQSEKRKDSTIVIELGKDYLERKIPDPFEKLKYLQIPQTSNTTETQQSNQANPN